jgi:hypothetical protein
MNDTTKDAALAAAQKNDLHASHGLMEVQGEATADGTITVRCLCGVMLAVKIDVAPPEPAKESPGRHVPRRVTVTDDDSKGGG